MTNNIEELESRQISNVENLLKDVRKLFNNETLKEDRKYARGDYYNIFGTLGLTTSEVRLDSAFIGELLNPSGAHGLGAKPLKLLLSSINAGYFEFDADPANVYIEHFIGRISEQYDSGGSIDIMIVDKNRKAIIIENKIYAQDQRCQLLRYHNYGLQNHSVGFLLLYLTLDGNSSSEYSTQNSTQHTCISYNDHITQWLRNCLEISHDKPRVYHTIEQYLTTLATLMKRHSEEYIDKLHAIITSDNNIDSVLEIIDNSGYVSQKIRQDFISDLEEMAMEEGYKMSYDQNIIDQVESGESWIAFYLRSDSEKDNDKEDKGKDNDGLVSEKWAFFLGQDKRNGSIYYGISLYVNQDKPIHKYQMNQLQHVWKEHEKCLEFPMGYNFLWSETGQRNSGRWYDWNNTSTLRDMRNGKMLEFIRTELRRVKQHKLIEEIVEIESRYSH